jgi:hypothetical protein
VCSGSLHAVEVELEYVSCMSARCGLIASCKVLDEDLAGVVSYSSTLIFCSAAWCRWSMFGAHVPPMSGAVDGWACPLGSLQSFCTTTSGLSRGSCDCTCLIVHVVHCSSLVLCGHAWVE